jgi:hypothetical protein
MDKYRITGALLATAVGVLCASQANSCKGQNSCKGKGWITTSSTDQCEQHGGKPKSS